MSNDVKQSIGMMEKAFVEHEDGNLFVQLAEAYRAAGDAERAMRVLRRGLENHPSYVPGFALLGVVLRDLGREAEAAVCFEQLLEMDPSSPIAQASLAEIAAGLARGRAGRNGYRHANGHANSYGRATANGHGSGHVVGGRSSMSAGSVVAEPPAASGLAGAAAPGRGGGWAGTLRAPRPHGDPLRPLVPGQGTAGLADDAAARGRRAHPVDPVPEFNRAGSMSRPVAGVEPVDPAALELADLLVGLLEYRDPFFRGGTSMTRLLSAAIARGMGLDEDTVNGIALGAVLRDLGQIPLKGLIDKSGTELGDDGRRRLAQHVDTALELLDGVNLPQVARDTIRYHHEWWDGAGYPEGHVGEAIPLGARIVAVADSFAAMIAARPHRLPMRVPDAIEDIRSRSGQQYDPSVVRALMDVLTGADWRGLPFGLRHRVLVVDPDETRSMVMATRLCSNGYLAETAATADAARERLRHTRIVGLIVSADLPEGRDGTLLREVREAEHDDMIPVVVTDAGPTQRVSLLGSGADVCLTADADFEELKATLEAFLRREGKLGPTSTRTETNWAGLQGDLQEFPLGWLLQVLNYDSRTAAVFLAGKGDAGAIYLERGTPCHAQTISLRGEEAMRAMLRWQTGSFSVDPESTTAEHTIQSSLMSLLLEEAVQDDHAEFFGAVKV